MKQVKNWQVRFEFANYAHIFLYLVGGEFERRMRGLGLVGRVDYVMDAGVEGNVTWWRIEGEEGVVREFDRVVLDVELGDEDAERGVMAGDSDNVNRVWWGEEEVLRAVEQVGVSLGREAVVKNLAGLVWMMWEGEYLTASEEEVWEEELAEGVDLGMMEDGAELAKWGYLRVTEDGLVSPMVEFGRKVEIWEGVVEFKGDALLTTGQGADSRGDKLLKAGQSADEVELGGDKLLRAGQGVGEVELVAKICDYYISAVALWMSGMLPEAVVVGDNERARVLVKARGELDLTEAVEGAIGGLKSVGFDVKMAMLLGVGVGRVREVLRGVGLVYG